MNNLRSQAHQEVSPQLPPSSSSSSSSSFSSSSSSSSSSSVYTHHTKPSGFPNITFCRQDNQDFPGSWSHLLLDRLVEEEEDDDDDDRCSFTPYFQPKRVEDWEDDQVLYPSPNTNTVDLKQESHESKYMYQMGNEELQDVMRSPQYWIHDLPASSFNSCATTSLRSSNMLDLSENNPNSSNLQAEYSSECNSITGSALKKARVQTSSVPQSTLKVRKEKLGDRISALHQLVSPFGKTDTASVLQEAIGYIRFLHQQIEALCLPYLVDGSTNPRQLEKDERSNVFQEDSFQDVDDERRKDLRSKGLCLVPVSLILHVERGNEANYWTSNLGIYE